MVKLTPVKPVLGIALLCIGLSCAAFADEGDPPTRIARVAYTQGTVSFQPAGTQDWVEAPVNRPLTTGDTVWLDQDSRMELELDGSSQRLSSGTELSFVNLDNDVTQVQLTSGTLLLRVRRLEDNETYEIDTPNLAFSVLRPGLYRISVDPSNNTTAVVVRGGQGEVTGNGAAFTMRNGDSDLFSGTDALRADALPPPDQDSFEAWSAQRDRRWDRDVSAQYVSSDVVGYQDLDDYGSWSHSSEYGAVWYPAQVEPGWAPYHSGHWSYIAPWGYTWVDDKPWGFAPYHYGRWVWTGNAWGWIPAAPRPRQGPYIRPVYAPALVAWVGAGAGIAWFALGPREVYVPSYHVSANYARNINISNTTVNRTVINNVYNTTVINNRTVNVTYINRGAPGAVTATSTQAFASAQPVQKNRFEFDAHAHRGGEVRAIAPTVVPTKQAVLGANRETARPPAQLQARTVIARTPPPPPPLNVDRRLQALRSSGGRPLSAVEVRQIAPSAPAARPVLIRVAPAVAPVAVANAPQRAASVSRPAPPPPESVPVSRPAPAAVHAKELAPSPRPASPSVADSVLEREHLQQQQALRVQQDRERLSVQQQQELEHQQAARQQAQQIQQGQQARALEVERQRQVQAQQQQQAQQKEQAQQQQQAQQRMQQQRAQQEQEATRAQQQELARQKAATQQVEQSRPAELERQHQLQTQQLQQRQIEQQQQLQARQREQAAQQNKNQKQPAKPEENKRPP
ncbi:MAG: DUF6600 domain-containing protein [Gammaproteobacteria bacterium]